MRKRWVPVLVLVFLFTAYGCSRLNQENYDQIEFGMSYEEVHDILGSPSTCEAVLGGKDCVWQDGHKIINAKFFAEKVIFFSAQNL